jgi:Na+-transporting NADH:ubiquinone oxidoreductase subunit C
MEKRTDKNLYTLLFATGMVIVVGSLLAFLASSLKPKINENKKIEKQQNILYAMGIHENEGKSDVTFIEASKVASEFSKYIKKQIVISGDLDIVEDNEAYLIDIKKNKQKRRLEKNVNCHYLLVKKMEKHIILFQLGV